MVSKGLISSKEGAKSGIQNQLVLEMFNRITARALYQMKQNICCATTRPPRSSSTAECLCLVARLKRGTGIYGLLGTSATV